MDENTSWKSQVALFALFFVAIVAAGAFRTKQLDGAAPNQAVFAPAASPTSPATDGEPPSNEITENPQLD